ncbi:MAG TPA: hypothetical protein VF271_06295 [Rhodanobacteraceae bacterium]
MTFRWLPDPDRYAHPRLSWLAQYAFDVVLGRLFRVDHDLPQGFAPAPGSIIVSNHLRDSDAPILGTLIYRRDGVRMRGVLPFFAMREDLFQRGALANLLYACPWPFIHLLHAIPLAWLFGNVRTLPMRRLREFTWHDTLRELVVAGMGAREPAAVFNVRGLRELHESLGRLPVRVDAIDPWRMGTMRVARWGLRRLQLEALQSLAPDFRAVVAAQLRVMADRLDAGQSLYFAPEGHISMDGRFGRIRAGTWRLGRMTKVPPAFLPVTLSYDALGPGRTRAIVRMGARLDDLPFDDPPGLARQVRVALEANRVVTLSHLLAWFLCHRRTAFAASGLETWVEQVLQQAREQGLPMDPLLARRPLPTLLDERLRWLGRKHLLARRDRQWINRWPPHTPPGWLRKAGIVRYLANALEDFAPALAKVMPPCE